jgi:CHASE3 domain sensor protein
MDEKARQSLLDLVEELRSLQLTEEEKRVLDDFEEFRRQHPICLASLEEEF